MSNRPGYFKERYERLKAEGYCVRHCNEDAVFPSVLCQLCLDDGIERRNDLIARGLCPGHPKAKAAEGWQVCQKCVDEAMARYDERVKRGVCPSHPRVRVFGDAIYCDRCLKVQADSSVARWAIGLTQDRRKEKK